MKIMSNPITRRTALAGAGALPLLPAASLAMPAESDPVVAAFREWQTLCKERGSLLAAYNALEAAHGPLNEHAEAYEAENIEPLYDRLVAAERRISDMIATTPAGLAAQLRILLDRDGNEGELSEDNVEGRMIRSILTAAENMA
jgi:hypothetical protein